MPIDYNDPDEIVLGKDLKVGDCIRSVHWSDAKEGNDMGIIIATSFCDDGVSKKHSKFFCDKPSYTMYDINCPSDGPYSTILDPDKEFSVIRSRKDILYTYQTIDYQLLQRAKEMTNRSNELDKIHDIAVDRMNNRLDKLKKEKRNES